jgi:hypothetical protein
MWYNRILAMWVGIFLASASASLGQDNPLIGVWAIDEEWQITELMFRSNGRYQLDTKSVGSEFGYHNIERGRYEINGREVTLMLDEYLGSKSSRRYEFEVNGDTLTLTRVDFQLSPVEYQLRPGSRADVLAGDRVEPDIIGTWWRKLVFFGKKEFTFRPGGYYIEKDTPDSGEFPPTYIRGRYEVNGNILTLKPYSGTEAKLELDFFADTLTLIRAEQLSGDSLGYNKVPDSGAEVRAKAAEAEAFLGRENWQAGVWKFHDGYHKVEMTIRPDGYYGVTNASEILRGTIRGRYTLEPRRIHLQPFIGQDLYSRDNGDYGKVPRTYEVDYYDGELQLIDPQALSQSVGLAHKLPGSDATVLEKVRQAEAERAREDWYIGIWEVNDPDGWMEFTFRPDNRYIAKSGSGGIPGQVERGEYVLGPDKLSLAPYPGVGKARGFELDLYDGDLYLVGDMRRLVIARKIAGSETGVIEKTLNPTAVKGEGGTILGLWTADMPGQSAELVFRPDGQFRLYRCGNNALSEDYGLYSVDMATRTLVYDSRFVAVQRQGLDFYGDTMTIFGGNSAPSTYQVNLGQVDAAIKMSLEIDAAEAQVDAQWAARVPIAPRNPNAVHTPVGNIPADPRPGLIFQDPTVFKNYQLYRRLSPSWVYFYENGTIKSVAVVNTREWHFFPTGRVLVRFTNYRAGFVYPVTMAETTDNWGAYRIGPKPTAPDILHLYADNELFIETDLGEQVEMTLEDGRRNLFWGKEYLLLSDWAAEQKTIPCQLPDNPDGSLMNTGVSLSTEIPPDGAIAGQPVLFSLSGPVGGKFTISGSSEVAGDLVIEHTTNMTPPIIWQAVQTNAVAAGPFTFQVPQDSSSPTGYFRVRR